MALFPSSFAGQGPAMSNVDMNYQNILNNFPNKSCIIILNIK